MLKNLKPFRVQTAKDLGVSEEMVKSIIDFQWDFTKKQAALDGNATIEVTEMFTLHWKELVAKRYIRHLNYILQSLYKNPEIKDRDAKIQSILEKITTCNSKMPENTQGYLTFDDWQRLQHEQEENMPI